MSELSPLPVPANERWSVCSDTRCAEACTRTCTTRMGGNWSNADEANASFGGVGASLSKSQLRGPSANVEAFIETPWSTIISEIPVYSF
ncbi:hypothetical protein [Arthrobacter sp. AQ5-05]|uniref:hypothetical protein n=1 Tax=Arthrobacter sp. AQ5-05 TaxID=2184581 RepID=UPI001C65E16B|nr:hypothetical protein [Arthrobacter sp. AQ5-05]